MIPRPAMKCILLPGLDGTGKLFSEFVAALSEHFEVTTVSYPADKHLSDAEFDTFLQKVYPTSEPFVLLAESYSAPIAIRHAASHPPNLKALILCAGFATNPVRGWKHLAAVVSAAALSYIRIPIPDFAARLWIVGPDAPPWLLARLSTLIDSVDRKVLSARIKALLNWDVRSALRQLRMPILYIRAQQDRLLSAKTVDELTRANPAIEIITLPGPHLLLERSPEKVTAVITAFVRDLDSSEKLSSPLST